MEKRKILDHGYVALVEAWGSDERVIEAARMSTDKGFLGWGPRHKDDCAANDTADGVWSGCSCGDPLPGDEKLLRYLWENKHSTPFEMAGAIFEVQAPIFVFREWHRHRTQSYNELSARYTPLPDVNYVPTVERLMMRGDGKNRQAGTVPGARVLDVAGAEAFRAFLDRCYKLAEAGYQEALANGVPKELARIHLPVARYSRMRASANLRNWLAFLELRSTEKNLDAQWEIRQFADALLDALAEHFPRTVKLFRRQQ